MDIFNGYTYFFKDVMDLEDLVACTADMEASGAGLEYHQVGRVQILSFDEMGKFLFNMVPKKKMSWLKASDKGLNKVVHVKRENVMYGYLVVSDGNGRIERVGMVLE